MNILIPHYWLLKHLKTAAKPSQIQKYLSLCGPSVESIERLKGEPVYTIEVTTNRVDCMSLRGIARETAAILPEFGIPATLIPLNLPKLTNTKPLGIKIQNDQRLCHRILAIKLENVNTTQSPPWLRKRLEQVGQRPLNNVIDVTNYVMWEIGHPIHAFDYDRLAKKTIVVRQAKKGEKLTTLDGKTHILNGGEVVFDDGTGTIIDLPGIMGTQNTVVTENTKNVLLWIESIDARKIRDASMGLAIRSQAAVLNEKHVDTELGLTTILRAVKLYRKVAKATVGSQLTDIYPNRPLIKSIKLPQKLLDTYMGLKVPEERAKRILENLGCEVKKTDETFIVKPPSWRAKDLTLPEDVIEEIARIYGYHNLPSIVMDTTIPDKPVKENFQLEHAIKQYLSGWGLHEVYTYSMISAELCLKSKFSINEHLKIKNPLLEEWTYMRRSLIPSHLKVFKSNKNLKEISIFEMANVYHPKKEETPEEELLLTITTSRDFKYLKGILDALLERLFIKSIQIIPVDEAEKPFLNNQTGEIYAEKKFIGLIGRILTQDKNPIYSIELLVKPLINIARTYPRYIPAFTTPPIIEELTFILPQKTYLGEVLETIRQTSKLIEKVTISKSFQQNYTFLITYRHPQKTLTAEELIPIRKKIVSKIQKSHSAKLVGKIN